MTEQLNNLEMEMSVLGSLLLDKDAIFKIADYLEPKDFYKTDHKVIYESILELYSEGKDIDLMSVQEQANKKKITALFFQTQQIFKKA